MHRLIGHDAGAGPGPDSTVHYVLWFAGLSGVGDDVAQGTAYARVFDESSRELCRTVAVEVGVVGELLFGQVQVAVQIDEQLIAALEDVDQPPPMRAGRLNGSFCGKAT